MVLGASIASNSFAPRRTAMGMAPAIPEAASVRALLDGKEPAAASERLSYMDTLLGKW